MVADHSTGIIRDTRRIVGDVRIALSPGFRRGTIIVPGQAVTMERVFDQKTATTCPEILRRHRLREA